VDTGTGRRLAGENCLCMTWQDPISSATSVVLSTSIKKKIDHYCPGWQLSLPYIQSGISTVWGFDEAKMTGEVQGIV